MTTCRPGPLLLLFAVVGPCLASDIPQSDPARDARKQRDDDGTEGGWRQLPALVVQGTLSNVGGENELIGPEAQPRWTARRRFSETRVYTVPDRQVEFEGWYTDTTHRHGQPPSQQIIYEIEMGLPWRSQVDVFKVQNKDGRTGSLDNDESGIELDHALARWGVIPGNPTLHGEYAVVGDNYDRIEGGLLLGDTLTGRAYWGANLRFERETGGDRERSFIGSAALGCTVTEGLSVGAEGKLAYTDIAAARGHYDSEAALGPSVQLFPMARVHLVGEVLIGLTEQSPAATYEVIAGCEF